MFALTTMYWILCVVFTFLEVDLWNTIVTACYGSDNALSCVVNKVQANHMPIGTWLAMFYDILFVNVSAVQYRVPASYPHTIRKHPPCTDSADPSPGNLIQYIIADGVLVWRTWVLCCDESRIVLMIPVVTLVINTSALSSSS
jgi:hypothetical protein